jgi:hypothetical protein
MGDVIYLHREPLQATLRLVVELPTYYELDYDLDGDEVHRICWNWITVEAPTLQECVELFEQALGAV